MGREHPFVPVKLFTGIIYRENRVLEPVKIRLEQTFSPIAFESEAIPFDLTDYYDQEMGVPLFRQFLAFSGVIGPDQLAGIKRESNCIEEAFTVDGKRSVNIDPGYLSQANVIIATTKNHYHRVPLKDGIYAHIEYVIKRKELVALEWTYPDFKKPEYLSFFQRLRLESRIK